MGTSKGWISAQRDATNSGQKLLEYAHAAFQYYIAIQVAAPGGFLGFLETSQDSGSTNQIVNTDGPLPAAVNVNKSP